ncbi:DUF433 domain-containing protein [Halosimplex halobium]|uniref:DUF433 domain-containing protein n=1 Tax=Halosimplex halobium TaxID=3396618 RepID=UPI003F5481ED
MAKTGQGPTGGTTDEVPRIVSSDEVLGGDPRIEGTRVGVAHVYRRHVEGGESPERIAAGYDISLAAVHAALAYGFSNADQMQAIAERDRAAREAATDRVRPEDAE